MNAFITQTILVPLNSGMNPVSKKAQFEPCLTKKDIK
jgi:hypothetical protein